MAFWPLAFLTGRHAALVVFLTNRHAVPVTFLTGRHAVPVVFLTNWQAASVALLTGRQSDPVASPTDRHTVPVVFLAEFQFGVGGRGRPAPGHHQHLPVAGSELRHHIRCLRAAAQEREVYHG